MNIKTCQVCSKKFRNKNRKYCSAKCRNENQKEYKYKYIIVKPELYEKIKNLAKEKDVSIKVFVRDLVNTRNDEIDYILNQYI